MVPGDVLSQKPETFYLPPWEEQFGRDYIGPQASALDASGRLYLCSGVDEMIVVDASNPAKPTPLWRLAPSTQLPALEPQVGMAVLRHRIDAGEENIPNHWGRCQHIRVQGDTLYFSHRGDHFRPNAYLIAYDVSAKSPRFLAVHPSKERHFEGFDVRGDLLFVAMHQAGLGVIRHGTAGFSALSELGGLGNAWDVSLSGNHAFVVSANGALHVLDIQDPSNVRKRASLDLEGSPRAIVLTPDGQTAYVAAGSSGLLVIDTSDARTPRITRRLDTPGSAVGLALDGERLALSDWNDTRVFDIATPRSPALLATRTIRGSRKVSRTVTSAIRGDHLFIAEWFGLHTYRIGQSMPLPDIQLRRSRVDFGEVSGEPGRAALRVHNAGSAPLEISRVVAGEAGSVVGSNLPLVIPPQASAALHLKAPLTNRALDTSLTLCSNDPDTPGLVLSARANDFDPALGRTAPEVELMLTDGTTWRLSEHRGKTVLLAYFATF
jgi:hypothetical protein